MFFASKTSPACIQKRIQHPEKLCLKQNDFQDNLNSAFGVLRNDQDFADVTLACEDGSNIEAHKVALASSSPFFMEMLNAYEKQTSAPDDLHEGVKGRDARGNG